MVLNMYCSSKYFPTEQISSMNKNKSFTVPASLLNSPFLYRSKQTPPQFLCFHGREILCVNCLPGSVLSHTSHVFTATSGCKSAFTQSRCGCPRAWNKLCFRARLGKHRHKWRIWECGSGVSSGPAVLHLLDSDRINQKLQGFAGSQIPL